MREGQQNQNICQTIQPKWYRWKKGWERAENAIKESSISPWKKPEKKKDTLLTVLVKTE